MYWPVKQLIVATNISEGLAGGVNSHNREHLTIGRPAVCTSGLTERNLPPNYSLGHSGMFAQLEHF